MSNFFECKFDVRRSTFSKKVISMSLWKGDDPNYLKVLANSLVWWLSLIHI